MSESLADLGNQDVPEPRSPEDFGKLATHWFQRYSAEPQTRDEHGQLKEPLARLFENRMNQCIAMHGELMALQNEAVIIPIERRLAPPPQAEAA